MDPTHEVALPAALAVADLGRVAVLLDIDGVLAPIIGDPASVAVPAATLGLLEELRDRAGVVGVVTGRMLEHARRLVPIDGIWLAAAHGMEIAAVDGSVDVDPVAVAAREQLALAARLAQTVGWQHEDKRFSVTMHFRHSANPQQTARGMRAHMGTVLDPRVVAVHDARMALEVRPIGARTKADAVGRIVAAAPGHIEFGVYLGDDRTDIDGFRGLEAACPNHLKVAVGSDEAPPELLELADLTLRNQAAVEGFLRALTARAATP